MKKSTQQPILCPDCKAWLSTEEIKTGECWNCKEPITKTALANVAPKITALGGIKQTLNPSSNINEYDTEIDDETQD